MLLRTWAHCSRTHLAVISKFPLHLQFGCILTCALFNCFQALYYSMEEGLLKTTALTTWCKKGPRFLSYWQEEALKDTSPKGPFDNMYQQLEELTTFSWVSLESYCQTLQIAPVVGSEVLPQPVQVTELQGWWGVTYPKIHLPLTPSVGCSHLRSPAQGSAWPPLLLVAPVKLF